MKSLKTVLCSLTLLISSLATAGEKPTINDLAFISGKWQKKDQANGLTEVYYSSAEAGSILGLTRMSNQGAVSFYEFERIVEEDGSLVLHPFPYGNVGVTFALTELEENRAVFENPTHDFPKVITFSLEAGALHLKVEGDQNGQHVVDELIVDRE